MILFIIYVFIHLFLCTYKCVGGVTGAVALGAEVRGQLQKSAQFFHIIVR